MLCALSCRIRAQFMATVRPGDVVLVRGVRLHLRRDVHYFEEKGSWCGFF